MKSIHKESYHNKKFIIPTLLILFFATLSFQAHAGGTVIIIGGSNYDRHHYSSNYGNSHRLRNKHYFESRFRNTYNHRYYGKRYNRNNYYGNSYRNNNRNYYRSNRSYCPN